MSETAENVEREAGMSVEREMPGSLARVFAFSRQGSFRFIILCFLLFVGALLWAKGRDPFERQWFTLRPPGQLKSQGVAVLAKTVPRPLPTVIYLYGSGGSLLGSGNEIRQMAEMGLAVVSIECCQTNLTLAKAQLTALANYLSRQSWVDTNHILQVAAQDGELRIVWEGNSKFNVQNSESERTTDYATRNTVDTPPRSMLHAPATFPLQDGERLGVFRRVGEYCLVQSKGPEALERYQSILEWQTRAKPLWLYWMPAFAWAGICFWRKRSDLQVVVHDLRTSRLKWVALPLASAALGVTGLHLVTPQLQVTECTLRLARRFLVAEKERADFELLAAQPIWREQKLKTLLEHVELANYNRELVNWKVDEEIYHRYVLSPMVETNVETEKSRDRRMTSGGTAEYAKDAEGKQTESDLGLAKVAGASKSTTTFRNHQSAIINRRWRRLLWESFYPRIRKEENPEAAAEIVARYLRERMTVVQGTQAAQAEGLRDRKTAETEKPEQVRASAEYTKNAEREGVAKTWQRQVTDEEGFELLYVAAMRSVGIAARLNGGGQAELWTGEKWTIAPRLLLSPASYTLPH